MNWETERVLSTSKFFRAFSPSNIALAKYWGKRDVKLNLPTNGSLSVTLKSFGSFTTVEFDPSFSHDRLILNGAHEPENKMNKVARVLDEVRALAKTSMRARVQSMNNFPTAAGLASSASGLSAVTFAASQALGLNLDRAKLSEIARKGSGSACRSFWEGFVEWKQGDFDDGTDSVGSSVATKNHMPMKIFIAVVNQSQKNHASTGGMEHTKKTSPFFKAWVEHAQKQTPEIKTAVLSKDFEKLALLVESNCIAMHASAMASIPGIFYWQPQTLEIIQKVYQMRSMGLNLFFTIDAGPNVVIFSQEDSSSKVLSELNTLGVRILNTEIGDGARAFDPNEWQGEA